ncbi:tetratricopeptide repeat protein, partial [Pseudomonas gessardii]|nr:tetratricopeptide repeat protein [Pseudomonas gessardii]
MSAAKREIETVIASKENEGHKIPETAAQLASQPWFAESQASASNRAFYQTHATAAETLLFSNLPWQDANIGEKFTVPGKEDKPKRRLFLKTSSVPTEVSISESKVGRKKLAPGNAVRIKGEFDDNQRFRIFVLEDRPSETLWDVFPEKTG